MNTKTAIQNIGNTSIVRFYAGLSKSHKFIIAVALIWLIQAIPKWGVAITADGELSAKIMTTFVTPRSERIANERMAVTPRLAKVKALSQP